MEERIGVFGFVIGLGFRFLGLVGRVLHFSLACFDLEGYFEVNLMSCSFLTYADSLRTSKREMTVATRGKKSRLDLCSGDECVSVFFSL